jgi:hypothetical protein
MIKEEKFAKRIGSFAPLSIIDGAFIDFGVIR